MRHLQTGGTRVPAPAEDGVQAADWPPQPTTLLCAAPGCPRYLKTESTNREGMMSREEIQRKEE